MVTLGQHQYGTADQVAHVLGPDVTPQRIRDWVYRGLLNAIRVPGATYVRLDQAADVERRTRTSTRGRPRGLDTSRSAA